MTAMVMAPRGITLVVEPRDADERLVTTAGDIYVAAFEPTATAQEASLQDVSLQNGQFPQPKLNSTFDAHQEPVVFISYYVANCTATTLFELQFS